MADEIYTEVESQKEYYLHPTGQFFGRCVDVIDLGERVSEAMGKAAKLQRRVAFVFRTGETNPETGKPVDLSKEFALSMFKQTADSQAPLRRFLEQWRGEPYKTDEDASRVPLHKCVGRVATINVSHEPWKSDPSKVSATIQTCTPIGKNPATGKPVVEVPEYAPYERAEFWTKRKEKYAKAATEYRAKIGAPKARQDDGYADDSALPF